MRPRVPWGAFAPGDVRDLYDDYVAALDANDYDALLELFVDDATYVVTARENVERGLPLAAIRCDSRAMLADRLDALATTQFFARRLSRHYVSAVRPVACDGAVLATTANFLLVEAFEGEEARVQSSGGYEDRIVATPDGLRFAAKAAVYDAALVPISLVVPL